MYFIRPWLAIGKYRETLDHMLLQANGIGAMLQLADPIEHPGIRSLYLNVEDGVPLSGELLRRGLDFIHVEREQGKTVLVACGAGISRSSTYILAALKENEGLSLIEGYRQLRQKHMLVLPHQALWESLCDYYGEPVPYMQLLVEYNR